MKSERESKISPARLCAFHVLRRIERDKAYSSILLPQVEEKLSRRDKKLCHELCLGVLRNQILLDKAIQKLSGGKKLDLEIQIILRLGIYQIAFLDGIPRYAAVNEAVEMTSKFGKAKARGLVNAILRRFDAKNDFPSEFADEIEQVSIETSHPRFLIERWVRQFGFEEASKLARANNRQPPLEFRFTAKTSPETKQRIEEFETEQLLELARKGEIYFQDKASQMVAEITSLSSDESFLDVCCAPGSKFTFVHFLLSQEPRKLFVGGDRFLQRLKIVKENCEKLGVKKYSLVTYDAEMSLPFADESFDVVLLDAPCSGTGTIRNNPEIRYFLEETDFIELQQKQIKMLMEAARVLKKDGRLIYSTCSLEREEDEEVIETFLSRNPNFSKVMPTARKEFMTAEGFLRTFPHRDNTSGFFVALLQKNNK